MSIVNLKNVRIKAAHTSNAQLFFEVMMVHGGEKVGRKENHY